MNICLMHYRVGETDGVSLEMEKWKQALTQQGHNVFFLAGDKGNSEAFVIPELSLSNLEMQKIHFNAYYNLKEYDEESLKAAVDKQADNILEKLIHFVDSYSIDVLVPNNILSLGHHISAAVALSRLIELRDLTLLCHHHDFYWERAVFSNPTCEYVNGIMESCFPPSGTSVKHCVINSIAQNALKEKKGLDSFVVPNVFDFERNLWKLDSYNSDVRDKISVKSDDVVFLQATRITDRKAIELAVDVISLLNTTEYKKKLVNRTLYNGKLFSSDSEIVLLLPGLSGKAESATGYKERIIQYGQNKNVRMIWCNNFVEDVRNKDFNDDKIYSLWDIYANCDFITYPSIQEGWGNQFLEAVFAQKPILLFEYPVFSSDIKKHGFEYVSLGADFFPKELDLVGIKESVIRKAADRCIEYLFDEKQYNETVTRNFNIGKKHFSLEALNEILRVIV